MLTIAREMHHRATRHTRGFGALLAVAICVSGAARAAYPPPCVEIGSDHPLFIFQDAAREIADATAYAQQAAQVWESLPKDLKPFSTLQVEARGSDIASMHQFYRALLAPLQAADVPVVIRIADRDLRQVFPLSRIEELLRDFACIQGVQAVELPFDEYTEFGADDPLGTPPVVRWLVEVIDLAARYGRLTVIELDQMSWPRIMSNPWCKPLLEQIHACAPYVVPIVMYRGPHTVPQTAAVMGLWLTGTAAQWGVGPQSKWYSDAHFIEPGVFGLSDQPDKMPSSLYRAMIFNGAMTGAAVYSFAPDTDLWFGKARRHWDDAIEPTLRELIDGGLIARQDFVRKKVRVAYQLDVARNAQDFHLNLRDIDGVLDKGFLIHGAYGMERPGQVPELILNTGRHYWVPILSAFATEAVSPMFEIVAKSGLQTSSEAWTEMLDKYYPPDGEGTAFICNVGRGVFVMNTCENRYEQQTFRVPAVPAPVRQFEAKRQDDGVLLTWPFRDGDLSYKIYKRVVPETRRKLLVNSLEVRKYLDTTADPTQTIAYAVTALTDDKEPYEGVVDYGEHLALSNIESRVAEEIVLGPVLGYAQSKPVEKPAAPPPNPAPNSGPWWPNLAGLDEAQLPLAMEIVRRIETWDRAFSAKDLDGVMDLYAADYEDPQHWRLQYVRRAYQWFFEHYSACIMHRQIRQWDFKAHETTGEVSVLLYCRFSGYAVTGPTSHTADLPAYFPRTNTGEITIAFLVKDGPWRILRTTPALPNFKDILSFSASPFDAMALGPDAPAPGNP